jgi:hypothetical protein
LPSCGAVGTATPTPNREKQTAKTTKNRKHQTRKRRQHNLKFDFSSDFFAVFTGFRLAFGFCFYRKGF